MSPQEFETKMQALYDKHHMSSGDSGELGHMEMDELLIECLQSLGYNEGCEIYNKVTKWYA